MLDLEGKRVLITGGSRGIGKACVEYLARAGASVSFTYNNNEAAAERLVKKISSEVDAAAFKVNLNSEDAVISCVRKAADLMQGIDVLVNNAGIWKYGRSDKMSLEEWDETIGLNLTGTFLFTREVIPLMKKQRSGKIINISSTAGQRGEAFHSHYAASKGGIISYTKSLAAELGSYNINVNCVAPGWVITDMTRRALTGEGLKDALDGIPLGRIGKPEDIAGAVLFLASKLSDHITGEVINVNGGSVLCG